ncbi:gamma-glutamyl-gamma-aminobutyrate hydrolase family protein [Candidatus Saccharibacteria bacterium]|nr:gamma-glutamyl-gamma-aminobutyrate hydrolase family protein [Candidatus Saccharibacteria bacterium]
MKILIINNHTVHMKDLTNALVGHDVEVQTYLPGIEFNDHDKDLIILSGGGGEGLEINDEYEPGRLWYDDEIEFIKTTKKPVLGICMGFEVIIRAFGGSVTEIGRLIQGFKEIEVHDYAFPIIGEKNLKQYESHRWRVKPEDLPSGFKALAKSDTGVEIVRYKNLLATQFHPEKGGTLSLNQLIENHIPARALHPA